LRESSIAAIGEARYVHSSSLDHTIPFGAFLLSIIGFDSTVGLVHCCSVSGPLVGSLDWRSGISLYVESQSSDSVDEGDQLGMASRERVAHTGLSELGGFVESARRCNSLGVLDRVVKGILKLH
jgi:hypothetical protein